VQYWGSLRRYTSTLAALDTLINQRITLLNPDAWADRNDRDVMALYATSTSGGSAFAYCMAEGKETAHHWQVFADRGFGVCIAFDKALLIAAISQDPAIEHGPVDYVNWRDLHLFKPLTRLPFIKRQVFRAEREYRLIAVPDAGHEGSIYNVAIPLNCITSLTLSGEVPAAHLETFKRLIRDIPDCGKLPVRQSGLLQNPRWAATLNAALADALTSDSARPGQAPRTEGGN
jgi:hypothetical protein